MLVLRRDVGQELVIVLEDQREIIITRVRENHIGISADKGIKVWRREVLDEIRKEKQRDVSALPISVEEILA